VFPSYRRKGNKVSVENQLQELPLQLTGCSGEQEGIFGTFFSTSDKAGGVTTSFCENLFQCCFLLISVCDRTAVLPELSKM